MYEYGKRTLSERLYRITQKSKCNPELSIKNQLFHKLLSQSKGIMVNFITYIAEALLVLGQFEMIHGNL